MAAGTAYSKRYAGGFADGSAGATPIDSTFLNAVEAALLQLYGSAPTADGQVPVWVDTSTKFGFAKILNANVDSAAAIAKSKLDLTGANGIVNADVAGAAAIAYSKLNLTGQILNADLAGSIATSKISGYLPGATIQRKSTAKSVNTTVAATDLLNGEITLPILTATNIVRITAWGDWLNNSGGAVVIPRFQLVLGGTTLIDTNVPSTTYTNDATRREWRLDALIANQNATGAQSVLLRQFLAIGSRTSGATLAAFTTGHGTYVADSSIAAANIALAEGGNVGAVDTSVAKLLAFNVINGSASASYETRLYGALVEIL